MAYLLDGAVILILLIALWLGVRRGLVKSLILLVGFVLAAVLAGRFSQPVATAVYDRVLADRVEQTVVQKVQETGERQLNVSLSTLFEGTPSVAQYIRENGWDTTVSVGLSDLQTESVQKAVAPAVEQAVRPALIALIQAVALPVIFLLLMAAAWLLSRLIDRIFRLPVLKQANRLGGGLMGLLQGLCWSVAFSMAVRLAVDCGWFSTPQVLADTLLVSRLASLI